MLWFDSNTQHILGVATMGGFPFEVLVAREGFDSPSLTSRLVSDPVLDGNLDQMDSSETGALCILIHRVQPPNKLCKMRYMF